MESSVEVTEIVARCGQIYKLTLMGQTLEVPNDFRSYLNLSKLSLSGCALKDDQMAILENLENLRSLEVFGKLFRENTKILVFSNGSFRPLQFLSLECLEGIREWRVEEGAMPSLRRLVIDNCRELSSIPDGLRHLTTLKELMIERMPRRFCSKVELGGEDFHKIQHVPSLVIQHQYDDEVRIN
jgi:hypothetical protein